MKEILLIALVSVTAILTVTAARQYLESFGAPVEVDMDDRLFPESI